MLKKNFIRCFLFLSLSAFISVQAWEFEQNIALEGVLKRAERTIIKNPDGEKQAKVERSIVLITDKPLVFSHSITIGKEQLASTETSYPHIEVYLPEEFMPLIDRHVHCCGNFRQSFDSFGDKVVLHINTALDCDQPIDSLKTVFYEPEEVEVSGFLHKAVYPGPPEYMSTEMGDLPEEVVILTLKNPINIEIKGEDNFNEPEKGVRELQVVVSDSMISKSNMKEEVTLKGTLYHAHTAHHRRRVLMMVKSWKANQSIITASD